LGTETPWSNGSSDVYKITVDDTPTNMAPVLSSITTPVTIPELSVFSFDADATDANSGDTLTFSLSGNPSGSSINASTGVFSWTPSEAQGPGDYTFTVMVSDGSLSDSQSVTIHVTEVGENPNPNAPKNKNECKEGGWKNFKDPSFKNQGQCVSYANHHDARGDDDQDENEDSDTEVHASAHVKHDGIKAFFSFFRGDDDED
jgi:hypothetical protein